MKPLQAASQWLAALSRRFELPAADRDVQRFTDCAETVRALLALHAPKHLLDVGAYMGNWAWVLRRLHAGLESAVLIEPQAKRQAALQAVELPGVRKTVFACAVGARPGSGVLTGGTASASLLAPREQSTLFPGSLGDETEAVEVQTLDALYAEHALPQPDLVKLDVQGAELGVLEGGLAVIAGARCLVVELSLRPFYEAQPPLWRLLRFLDEQGFELAGRGYEWRLAANPAELLQFDGIFLRRGAR